MKSRIKTATYIPAVITMTIFIALYALGTFSDNEFRPHSLLWWIVGILIVGFFLLIRSSFKSIPKIEVVDNVIHFYSKSTQVKVKIGEITKLERVKSMINGWYSFRGGLKIYTEKEMLVFPYHVYSNEAKLLQLFYLSENSVIKRNCSLRFGNMLYMKYFYRSFGSFYLLTALVITYILMNKEHVGTIGFYVLSAMILLFLAVGLLLSKYVKVENGYLYHFSPLIMKRCEYALENIEYANSKAINTGGNGPGKNLTLELINKQILTLSAGLNRQKELDSIALEINDRSSNV